MDVSECVKLLLWGVFGFIAFCGWLAIFVYLKNKFCEWLNYEDVTIITFASDSKGFYLCKKKEIFFLRPNISCDSFIKKIADKPFLIIVNGNEKIVYRLSLLSCPRSLSDEVDEILKNCPEHSEDSKDSDFEKSNEKGA